MQPDHMRWPERLDPLHYNTPSLEGDEEILEPQFAPFRIDAGFRTSGTLSGWWYTYPSEKMKVN